MATESGISVRFKKEAEIGKFAFNSGIVSVVRRLVNKYPRFCRSSSRNIRNQYKGSLKAEKRIVEDHSSGTQNTARMYQQKRIVRKAHKGSYMKFSEADRDIIAKAVIEVGAPAALQKFKPFFPRLRESTCRYLRDRYIKSLGLSPKDLKSRNILSELSPSVSLARKQDNNNLISFGVEPNKSEHFYSQGDTNGTRVKSSEYVQTTRTSYTVLSSSDHLPSNDINNSAGNYENFNQRNLRNDGESTSKGHLPVHMSGLRSMTKATMRMSKGRYTRFCREEREEIGKYAYIYGATKAMRHLRDKYPQLRESTCRLLRDKYMASLKEGQREQIQAPSKVATEIEGGEEVMTPQNVDNHFKPFNENDDLSSGDISFSSIDSPNYSTSGEIVTVITKENQSGNDFEELPSRRASLVEEKGGHVSTTKKRGQYNKYDEDDRCEIGMFASQHGIVATLRHFKDRFPNLNESTCRNFRDRYNVIVGLEGTSDVSEFDPVSFVDVYSNVKLSDNSEGILTKPVNHNVNDQRGDSPPVSTEEVRDKCVNPQAIHQGRHIERGSDATFAAAGRGEQQYQRYESVSSTGEGPGEELYPSPDMRSRPSSSSREPHNSYREESDHFDDFGGRDDARKRGSGSGKSKVKRGSYCKFNEDAKIEIGKFASRYGVSRTYMYFQPKYPRLKESTCRYFKELYEKELKWKDTQAQEPESTLTTGPKIVIRPASQFERSRKPIVVKAPRGLSSVSQRFLPPTASISHQQSSYGMECIRSEEPEGPEKAAYVGKNRFSCPGTTTDLHISNVESLRNSTRKSPQPFRIKIEDENEDSLPQETMDQRDGARSTPLLQSMRGGGTGSYVRQTSGSTDSGSKFNDTEMSTEENLHRSYLHNTRDKIGGRAESARTENNFQQINDKNGCKPTSVMRYSRPGSGDQNSRPEESLKDVHVKAKDVTGEKRTVTAEDAEASIVKFLKLLLAEGGDIGVSAALSIARGVIESRNKHLLSEYGGSVTLTKGWIKAIISRHNLSSETSYC